MTECVFCAIVAGDVPADRVAEDEHTVSFMDINPVNPGHVLTVPRRHAVDIWDLTTGEAADLMAATHRVCDQIRRALDPAGLDLFVANGEAAGQTVFHLHVHSIPRSPGDSWIDPWTPPPAIPPRSQESPTASGRQPTPRGLDPGERGREGTSMRIGELASDLGVSSDTLRFYERSGLLPRPSRGENGYRDYSALDVERLRLIIELRRLDVPISDAARIAHWCQSGHCAETSAELPDLLGARRAVIHERIDGLRALDERLAQLQGHLSLAELPLVGESGPCCASAAVIGSADQALAELPARSSSRSSAPRSPSSSA